MMARASIIATHGINFNLSTFNSTSKSYRFSLIPAG